MVHFTVRKSVKASKDVVLGIISNVEDYPKYWHGHREVKIIDRSEDTLHVYIKFAFNGPLNHGDAYVKVSNDGVLFNFISGPFKGTHRIHVADGELISDWDIELHPLLIPVKGWIINHFKQGSEHALERIIKDAESHSGKANT
ncbi:SRPBCC family protein [Caldivirga sp.]|uniref:type II toxin-antitoxin system RatA family toxin n=1 Tax=Caldivirga sp. TaxID=2080243 RepID=UPI0025C310F7|nr:SRPBCC family protein [Caldivirga sp.]